MLNPSMPTPSKHTLYMRKWRASRVEQNAAYQKKYQTEYLSIEKNRLAGIARASDWQRSNAARAKTNKERSYLKNKELHLQRAKEWIAGNIERHREYQRRYQSGRRALIKNVWVDFDAIVVRCGGICGICAAPIRGAFHFDHIIPLAKGGPHSTQNIQQAHPRCNQIKGAKLKFAASGDFK